MAAGDDPHPRTWYSTNLVGVPAPLRASTRAEEQFIEGALRQGGHAVMRLNNPVSFALEGQRADCFGDWMPKASVPTAKLLFYPGLLHASALSGEGEVPAIGGDCEVALACA